MPLCTLYKIPNPSNVAIMSLDILFKNRIENAINQIATICVVSQVLKTCVCHCLFDVEEASQFEEGFNRNLNRSAASPLAPAGIFSGGGRGSEVHQGRACKVVAAWGLPGDGAPPPDAGEIFKKQLKKQ